MAHSEQDPQPQGRGEMRGTKPVTDRESKMVMLRAERGDGITIDEVVHRFVNDNQVPGYLETQRRISTYYGTELLLEPDRENARSKFLLTAPGPDTYLYLWASETDADGFREGWRVAAEVKASFSDKLPQYSICSQCGEPIKSLEHEKLAATDNCPSG